MRKNKIVRPINSNSTLTPNIIRGGKAIDLGNNMYYIAGRKHTNGGVDVGKDLEVEGGEVMQMKPNEVRVFSSVPFLRASSPAQLVLGGANPDVVFNAQEEFKDRNRIKDDGTRYKCGGRKKAKLGTSKNGEIYGAFSDNNGYGYLARLPEITITGNKNYYLANKWNKEHQQKSSEIPIKAYVNKEGQLDYKKDYKPGHGNLEIVSPEFDLLTVGPKTITSAFNIGSKIGQNAAKKLVGETASSIISEVNPSIGLLLGTTNNLPNVIKKGKTDIVFKPRFKNLNNQLKIDDKSSPRLSLPRKVSRINEIQSNGETIIVPEFLQTNIDETRNWIKKFNKWNTHYGYDPIPLDVAKNPKEADKLIQERLLEHNTFVRGVRDVHGDSKIAMNAMLQSKGIEPTRENRLKYMATTYAPETGAGRTGFYPKWDTEGSLYTSNSYQTAAGYSKGNYKGFDAGEVAKVRRPISFEGSRDNWVRNAEFAFDNTKSNIYRDYELPYLLREGKSIRSDILKNKDTNITDEEYNNIYKRLNDEYLKGFGLVNNQYVTLDEALKEYKDIINKYNPDYKLDIAFTKDPIQTKVNKTKLRKILEDVKNISELNYADYHKKRDAFLKERGLDDNDFLAFLDDDYNQKLTAAKIEFDNNYKPEPNNEEIIKKKINNIFGKYANKKYNEYLTKYIAEDYNKTKNKLINDLIKNKNKVSNKEIIDYANKHSIYPNRGTDNVFTTERLVKTSRNKGNPYQHFIFRGEVGQPALDFVEFVPKENYIDLKGITRQHEGQATKGLSRKSRKYGGNMIATINGNVKNGLIHVMKCGGRKKAELGKGFRINNQKYNVGDTIVYNDQPYVISDRNTATPIQRQLPNTLSFAENLQKASNIKLVDRLNDIDFYNNRIKQDKANTEPALPVYVNNIAKPLTNVPNTTLAKRSLPVEDNAQLPVAKPSVVRTTPKVEVPKVEQVKTRTAPVAPTERSFADTIGLTSITPRFGKLPTPAIRYNKLSDDVLRNVLTDNYSNGDNKTRRFSNWFDNNIDKINLFTNLGGAGIDFIASSIINSKMPTVDLPTITAPTLANLPEIKLAEVKDLEAPMSVAAAKLKTRYNANPQLAKIEDETRRTMNEIDRNTADSRVALARKQRAAIRSQEAKNQVYGQKENIETELMNRDRLNAQQVAQANVAAYNNFLTARAQQAMQKAQLQLMVDRANIGNKLAVDQFNANAKLATDQFNTNNIIKELLFNNNVRANKLGNYAAGIGNLFNNIGGALNNYMVNRNARLRDEEVLRSLRARYKEIPEEIMNYILNK